METCPHKEYERIEGFDKCLANIERIGGPSARRRRRHAEEAKDEGKKGHPSKMIAEYLSGITEKGKKRIPFSRYAAHDKNHWKAP